MPGRTYVRVRIRVTITNSVTEEITITITNSVTGERIHNWQVYSNKLPKLQHNTFHAMDISMNKETWMAEEEILTGVVREGEK